MSNREVDAGFAYCNKCGNPWPCVRHTDSGDLQEEIDRLRDQIATLEAERDLADRLYMVIDAHYGLHHPMTDPTLLAVVAKYKEARRG